MQQGKVKEAIEQYEISLKQEKKDDFLVLEQMALMLLEKGISSNDLQDQLLSTFGAGISANQKGIPILAKALKSKNLQNQLTALYFLSNIPCNESDQLLISCMQSPYLMTRLEAGYALAQRKHPQASSYIENLMVRLPPFLKYFFPKIFALAGTKDSMNVLKGLLEDKDPMVTVETIHSITSFGRDDFLPHLRKKITHENIAEKEACAFALGYLQDSESIPYLEQLAVKHGNENVRLAAQIALYNLGQDKAKRLIENQAKKENPFAIHALSSISDSKGTLYFLLFSQDLNIAANAAISLLKQKDDRGLPLILDLLVPKRKDLRIMPVSSLGRTHFAYTFASKAYLDEQQDPDSLHNLSLLLREQLLQETSNLKEETFLPIIEHIFSAEQMDLIPSAVSLLEGLKSKKAIALLKEGAQKLGTPLIRIYCNLALYRLGEKGSYEKVLYDWMEKNKDVFVIKLRPYLPTKERENLSQYTLTPEEKSRLLLECFSALAAKQDTKSIQMILEMIKNPQSKNRYALAGVLLQTLH